MCDCYAHKDGGSFPSLISSIFILKSLGQAVSSKIALI